MNRSEKKTRPQRRERQLENAKKWEKWRVCWFTGECSVSANLVTGECGITASSMSQRHLS